MPTTPIQIGPVTISPPLALAPMAGLTYSAFRRMVRSLGSCGLVVTEMISASACSPKALKKHHMLDFYPDEHPIAAQISGYNPETMARAAAAIQEYGVDILDINAGCPARRITAAGGGSALLKNLSLLESIVRAVRASVQIPVTLKFRSGWDARSIVAVEVAQLAEECGCAAITLHARTRDQGYSGQADWSIIRRVVEAVRIPVWASGDIRNIWDAQRCFEETGCAGLMIARGALVNPWVLRQIDDALNGREPYRPSPEELHRFLHRFIDLLLQDMPNEQALLGRVKGFVGRMHNGMPAATLFRSHITHSHSVEEVRQVIDRYLEPFMSTAPLVAEEGQGKGEQ